MSSKLTELTEFSPSAPPPSVLCGSGVFSQLSSPSMASSGQFDLSQTYDGYRAVEVLDPACFECLAKGGIYEVKRMGLLEKNSQSLRNLLLMELQDFLNMDVSRWTSVGGPIPVGGRPIYSSSEVPTSRTNTEGVVKVVKRIRRIDDSPIDPDAEGSDELDGEEILKPSNSQYSQNLPTNSCFHSYYHSSSFTKYFPHQAYLESRSKTITSSAIQKLTHNHLPPTPAEEEMDCPLYCFLPLKFFKEENVGLSGLPEKIPTRLVKTKNQ
ncbi:hypothetical protein O181_078457 [Austropuccinia psidii MF-1]|uniref:Uncharacterized protein n=1 Tax=Austropuccinia psidii MF-1 TaxID=1389203 RepID=A0A9Q3FKE0_9BASI|nr:hypothetical protein [Austropuccinia psidii MF-1]